MALAPFNNCTAAEAFARYRPLDYALAAELLFSLVTLFAFVGLALRLRKKSRRPVYHPNLKLMSIAAVLFYVLHALANVLRSGYYELIRYRSAAGPCFYAIPSWLCLLEEIPIFMAGLGFALSHTLIFLERCLATLWLKNYEQTGLKPMVVPLLIA
ncbi:hypothetical protein AAVH_31148, partial [Aphelenchoides avenae]